MNTWVISAPSSYASISCGRCSRREATYRGSVHNSAIRSWSMIRKLAQRLLSLWLVGSLSVIFFIIWIGDLYVRDNAPCFQESFWFSLAVEHLLIGSLPFSHSALFFLHLLFQVLDLFLHLDQLQASLFIPPSHHNDVRVLFILGNACSIVIFQISMYTFNGELDLSIIPSTLRITSRTGQSRDLLRLNCVWIYRITRSLSHRQ